MIKKIIIAGFIIIGIQQGIQYLLSDQFQKYADSTKAPWTCKATNYMGRLMQLLDNPPAARSYYERVVLRCPNTELAARAAFGVAQTWDDPSQPARFAMTAYTKFIEDYEKSPYVKNAQEAIERIKSARSL